MNVRFCHECRSLILADFRFCPYCGAASAKGPGLSEALAGPFDRLGAASPAAGRGAEGAAGRVDVFAGAAASLDRLESDMDLILEELEREGRAST